MKSSQQDKLHIPLSDTEFNLALLGITNTHPSLPSLSLSLLTDLSDFDNQFSRNNIIQFTRKSILIPTSITTRCTHSQLDSPPTARKQSAFIRKLCTTFYVMCSRLPPSDSA